METVRVQKGQYAQKMRELEVDKDFYFEYSVNVKSVRANASAMGRELGRKFRILKTDHGYKCVRTL